MQMKSQRRAKPDAFVLIVTLVIVALSWAAMHRTGSSRTGHFVTTSLTLLEGARPAEAEHENGLKELLARMLDRRMLADRAAARAEARAAAYDRRLKSQVSWQANWDAIAMCESSQRWHLNVGIFDGGLQFLPSTWNAYGGRQFAAYAWQATRLEQIVVASRVLSGEGPSAWPHCFRWG
jgi:hypothetical protein